MTDAHHQLPRGANDESITLTLTRRDVEEVKRLLALISRHEERGTAAELARIAIERRSTREEQLAQRARDMLVARQRRKELFGAAMFGEPAWDILLLLYATDGAARQTTARLAELSGASKTTAFRWIDYLIGQQLVWQQAHPTDRRSTFLELTGKGREMLQAYLADTLDLTD